MTSYTTHTQICSYYDEKERNIVLSVAKLWEQTEKNEIFSIPLSELETFLDEEFWDDDNAKPITPNQMSQRKDDSCSYHQKALRDCDLLYPILVKGNSKTLKVAEVFDGVHRLLKAKLLGWEKINVKFVTAEQHDASLIAIEEPTL